MKLLIKSGHGLKVIVANLCGEVRMKKTSSLIKIINIIHYNNLFVYFVKQPKKVVSMAPTYTSWECLKMVKKDTKNILKILIWI